MVLAKPLTIVLLSELEEEEALSILEDMTVGIQDNVRSWESLDRSYRKDK